ncbi:zinc-binding protein A33-like [Perca fluviatilis]|uniref:zinc-binding protein A33-like n=1 Tax=Perca fluviatilis TaxID=8168 RepID=UPI00196593E6|nr:zinc-binding protein A33-like [Perca fluviatilis]
MAENTDLVESYLNCHVCSETFRDPVSLSCNHSFCSSCLHTFWEQANNKNCPICKRKSSKEIIGVNFTLNELADNLGYPGEQKSESSETGKEKKKVEVVCDEHPEVPYLFCKDEDRVVCPVCEFSLHHGHTVIPVEQVVRDLKEQLKSDLQSLQDKRDKHRRVEETYDEITPHSKKQLLSTERQIRAEFNKLHQFLKEEEESRLAALREEEQQMGKRIQEQISSLSDSISAVEADLQKDSVPFLSSYKASQSRARVQCSLSDPQLLSGALTDVAKHLGNLSFRVWEKMKDKVHFCPVILDPNTAHSLLCLSDDLTSVRWGDTNQKLPDNPERYSRYASVLGSEGFSSGKHSWEVEVGDYPNWNVGLAKESADRKGEIHASPEYGLWCLVHHSGKYNDGSKSVKVKKSLQRIRVQLDYEGGEVSFYNAEDMTHISTLRDTFTEKLFPWFSIGPAGDAKTAEIKICPAEISLRGSENSETVERGETMGKV